MKNIFENWREFLNEEFEHRPLTVGDILKLIDITRDLEGTEDKYTKLKALADDGLAGAVDSIASAALDTKVGGVIPVGTISVGLARLLWNHVRGVNSAREAGALDSPEDYPILDVLGIDPGLVKTIEDDILHEIDEQYQKFLAQHSPDTEYNETVNINEYVRNRIAEMTDSSVVITDESGKK